MIRLEPEDGACSSISQSLVISPRCARVGLEPGLPLYSVCVSGFNRDGTTGGYLHPFSCHVCTFSSSRDPVEVAEKDSWCSE